MQYFVKQRATETGDITTHTPAIDVSGASLLVTELIIYSIAATGPSVVVDVETSNDLETWATIGSQIEGNAAGSVRMASAASVKAYGKYVRFLIVISGTTTELEYSLVLNTHASS